MSKRTTIAEVVLAVRHLNSALGYNGSPGVAIGSRPDAGCFFLQGAYGGWQLQRVHPAGGTVSVTSGYRSKRELLALVEAIRCGVMLREERNCPIGEPI